jgi:hypothetical protein
MAVQGRSLQLLDLPSELQTEIVKHLNYFDKSHLRWTSRHFYSTIPAATHADLLEAEELRFCQRGQFYTCRYCVRLRPGSKFADTMKKGKKRYLADKTHLRYCLDCGLHTTLGAIRYSRGTYITMMDQLYVICMDCSDFNPAIEKCKEKICLDCHWRRKKWMQDNDKQVFVRREYRMAQNGDIE